MCQSCTKERPSKKQEDLTKEENKEVKEDEKKEWLFLSLASPMEKRVGNQIIEQKNLPQSDVLLESINGSIDSSCLPAGCCRSDPWQLQGCNLQPCVICTASSDNGSAVVCRI